jgi:hypothetical protein
MDLGPFNKWDLLVVLVGVLMVGGSYLYLMGV